MAMKNQGATQSEEYANVILYVIFQFLYLNIYKHKTLNHHFISIFAL